MPENVRGDRANESRLVHTKTQPPYSKCLHAAAISRLRVDSILLCPHTGMTYPKDNNDFLRDTAEIVQPV